MFGEEAADLELGIRRRLDSPEQLQHVAVAAKGNAVRLFAAAARPFEIGRQVERSREAEAAHGAARRSDLLFGAGNRQQATAHIIVLDAIDDDALARAGDSG